MYHEKLAPRGQPLGSKSGISLQAHQNPLDAWKAIVENPEKAKSYKQARGKGGFVRAEWPEVLKLISASLLYTVMKYGPDRNVGFSPIPAMSMISHASGSRFMSLIGGPMLSFYDWYADLPPASPQINLRGRRRKIRIPVIKTEHWAAD